LTIIACERGHRISRGLKDKWTESKTNNTLYERERDFISCLLRDASAIE